jgi:hydrogenase expression/formation protein
LSDLEGLTRRLLKKGYSKDDILKRLVQEYLDFKEIGQSLAYTYAKAIYEECRNSDISNISNSFIKNLLDINKADITVGKQGVGCRGAGDFFVHKLIAELSEIEQKPFLAPSSLDDAGAIRLQDLKGLIGNSCNLDDLIIVSKMEGIHSRLSDFPFICGFHVISCKMLT